MVFPSAYAIDSVSFFYACNRKIDLPKLTMAKNAEEIQSAFKADAFDPLEGDGAANQRENHYGIATGVFPHAHKPGEENAQSITG